MKPTDPRAHVFTGGGTPPGPRWPYIGAVYNGPTGVIGLTVNQGAQPIIGVVPVTFAVDKPNRVSDVFLVVDGVVVQQYHGALGLLTRLLWDSDSVPAGSHTIGVFVGALNCETAGFFAGAETVVITGQTLGPCGSAYLAGKAAGFNGTSSFLEYDDPTVFSGSSVAVGVWCYLSSKGASRAICGKYDNSDFANSEWLLFYNHVTDRITMLTKSATSSSSIGANTFGSPPLNTWFHVWAWVGGGAPNISVNDGTVSTGATPGAMQQNLQPFRVGMTADGALPWHGRLADLLVYSGVPAGSERTSIYNSGVRKTYEALSGSELTSLISAYPLREVNGVSSYCDYHGSNVLAPADVTQAEGP